MSITRLQEVRNAIQSLTVPAHSNSLLAGAAAHLAMFGDLLISLAGYFEKISYLFC